MKKLLLIIPLLFGCARKYECDVGTIHPDTGEFHSTGAHGSTTTDWWDFRYTKEDAKEDCEAVYNDGYSVEIHCRCRYTSM